MKPIILSVAILLSKPQLAQGSFSVKLLRSCNAIKSCFVAKASAYRIDATSTAVKSSHAQKPAQPVNALLIAVSKDFILVKP